MRRMTERRPVEPPATRWRLPRPEDADADGIVGIGGDLEPGTLLAAYRQGLFPMPYGRRHVAWFSPDPRAVIPLDGLRVSRSLRRSMRRFEVRRDERFGEVMVRCGDPRPARRVDQPRASSRPTTGCTGWGGPTPFECVDDDGQLVGGLYGVRIDGLFAGESMFHDRHRRLQGRPRRARRVAAGDRRPVCSTCSG